jgi:hypothetical protein
LIATFSHRSPTSLSPIRRAILLTGTYHAQLYDEYLGKGDAPHDILMDKDSWLKEWKGFDDDQAVTTIASIAAYIMQKVNTVTLQGSWHEARHARPGGSGPATMFSTPCSTSAVRRAMRRSLSTQASS